MWITLLNFCFYRYKTNLVFTFLYVLLNVSIYVIALLNINVIHFWIVFSIIAISNYLIIFSRILYSRHSYVLLRSIGATQGFIYRLNMAEYMILNVMAVVIALILKLILGLHFSVVFLYSLIEFGVVLFTILFSTFTVLHQIEKRKGIFV